jgi:hypothetical protein
MGSGFFRTLGIPLLSGREFTAAYAGLSTRVRLEANLFFRLVSLRYERGSLLLTSNKHVRDWPEIFAGDEILTTAILDRLLHHVAVVHIDGQSYRLRELGALLSPTWEVPRGQHGRSNDPR